MNFTYAGIGSRDTPDNILSIMVDLGRRLTELGFTLHSGGAKGADSAFEQGCDKAWGSKRIFLPYKGFHGSTSELYNIDDDAIIMAQYYHPQGRGMSDYVMKMMARNCYQMLDANLQSPVDFMICWTEGGKITGGYRTAV